MIRVRLFSLTNVDIIWKEILPKRRQVSGVFVGKMDKIYFTVIVNQWRAIKQGILLKIGLFLI